MINVIEDAKKVTRTLLENTEYHDMKITVGVISNILNTSNTYRVLAVRDILIKNKIIDEKKRLNKENAKKFLESDVVG